MEWLVVMIRVLFMSELVLRESGHNLRMSGGMGLLRSPLESLRGVLLLKFKVRVQSSSLLVHHLTARVLRL